MNRGARAETPVRICAYRLSNRTLALLERLLADSNAHEIVATCQNENDLEQFLAERPPDLLLVPLSNLGHETIERLMATSPLPIAAITAEDETEQSSRSMLAAGALEVLTLPDSSEGERASTAKEDFLQRLRILGGAVVVRHPRGRLKQRVRAPWQMRPQIIAICASTGGPQLLAQLLGALPQGFDVPIVTVQHLSRKFIDNFTQWLQGQCTVRIRIAEDGDRPQPGTVYIAPIGVHLTIDSKKRLHLAEADERSTHIPSGNVLMESIARHYGKRAVGVILSGIGSDGASGLARIKDSGGLTIAQDEATSIVWGMPQAAAKSGAAKLVLSIDEIVATVIEVAGGRR